MIKPLATVVSETNDNSISMSWWHEPALPVGTKLYAQPAEWQGLTDSEKTELSRWAHPDIIESIELKLQLRNTPKHQ